MHGDDSHETRNGQGDISSSDADRDDTGSSAQVESSEIMSSLPRSRPHRRSERRTTGSRKAAKPKSSSQPRPKSQAPKSTASAATRPAPEPPPGLASIALRGAVEIAKLPVKVGAQVTFRALDAVARELRSR